MRNYFNQEAFTLRPEQSTNWAIGFDFTPAGNFLTGLNLQATYYIVKINGILQNFGNPTDTRFNDSSVGFAYMVPSDMRDATGTQVCPGMDATPWLCAPFQEVVTKILAYQGNPVPPEAQTLIYWINDGGTMNKGWQKTEGVDWQASYDWEWADLGAFNVGITGTYYLSQKNQRVAGDVISDFYHTTLNTLNGVEQIGVEFAAADEIPRTSGLERRDVEPDRLHGLPATLLPHASRPAERQFRMPNAGRHGRGRNTPLLGY